MRLAGLILAAAAAGLVFAHVPAGAQAVAVDLRPGEVLLNVEAEGISEARPDLMTVTAGVVTTGDSAGRALEANSQLADRMIEAVRRHGVEPRDIRTTELTVTPQFEELSRGAEESGRVPRILGYVATNKVELRLRDLASAPLLIDTLFTAGANNVHGPQFAHSDPTLEERKARHAAVAAARLEADTYAEALGMRVARILRVSERGPFDTSARYISVSGSRIRPTPIEPGALTTRIDLWIDYALVPR